MKQLLLKTWLMLVCLIVGVGTSWADTYVQLTSISEIDESADYVLGIDGEGFHKSGTSSWGVCTNNGGGTPLVYNLVKAANGNTFKAITVIGSTTYYLTVPTSNTFTMATSSTAANSDLIIGTTQVSTANCAVANSDTTARHLRLNGTSGLRSYAGATGEMAYFYKVIPDGPAVSSIAIKTAPTKTTYMEGEKFDPTGLVITKTLSNANTEDVAYSGNESSFTFNPSLTTELSNETSVTITYGKKTTTQAITVNPFVATAGTYNIVPNNVFWGKSTQDGSTSVTANTTFGPVEKYGVTFEMNSGKSTNSYMKSDHSRAYDGYTLKLTAPSGFNLTAIDFTGSTWLAPTADVGTVNSKKWTGEAGEVTFRFSGTSYMSNIKVTYSTSKTLQTVTVSGTPTKTTYTAGESFEPAGLTVTGHYDDESDETITEGITWSTPAALTAGQTSVGITATVGGVTSAEYTVTGLTVNAPLALSSITATGTPAEFWKGDTFNHNGITITATWSDESTTDVTSSCTFTGYDMSTPGQQTVTVTYQGETCQYDIEVKTIANTQETAYTVAQAKALIDAGKDLTTQVYVKGIVSEIVTAWSEQYSNITYAISDDGQTSGTQFQLYRCVTNGAGVGDDVIAYGTLTKHNDTYEFSAGNTIVDIAKPEVESIRIEGTPSQLTYYQGDTFSTSGLSVIATYSNGNELNVIDDATISITPQTLDELGEIEVSVTVTYEGETDTQTYNVVVEEAPIVVTIDLSKDETTNASTTELIWVTTEVAVLAEKGTSTTNANNYYPGTSGKNYTSTRFYPNSVLTFIPTSGYAITSIEYVATTTGYATALVNSTWTNATASASGKTVTISPFDGSKPVIAKIGAITGGTSFVFNCEQVLPVTFKEAGLGYATVYSERALSIPEGVEAYYTTLNGNGYMEPHALTDVIPAETGVVLKYTGELTEDEVVAFSYTSKTGEDVSDNVLTGTTTDIVNPGNAYVFSVVNEEPGFYKYADGATLGANKAYYVPSASSDVQCFVLDFEGLTTSISNVSTGSNLNGSFDLQGRRVNAATRGLFIQNGKKVIK